MMEHFYFLRFSLKSGCFSLEETERGRRGLSRAISDAICFPGACSKRRRSTNCFYRIGASARQGERVVGGERVGYVGVTRITDKIRRVTHVAGCVGRHNIACARPALLRVPLNNINWFVSRPASVQLARSVRISTEEAILLGGFFLDA